MRKNDDFYFLADKRDVPKVDGDLALFLWYSKLKDYTKRFSKDEYGYIRIPPRIYEEDLNMSKKQAQRYNKKLEDKGLIKVDKIHRGNRTWAGFKLV